MLAKYNSFTEDLILEKMINESFLYLSPNVRKVLGRLFAKNHSDIAEDILGSEGTDVKPDITFVDLGKEGYLSFITMRNAKPLINARYPNLDWAEKIETEAMPDFKTYSNELHELDKESDRGSGVFNKSRNEVGIGRFVNKLFPGKYNSKQIEEFINNFKATLEKSGESFDLVEGEDISKYYWYENYKEMSGTLGNSCMAKKRDLFEIYTQNQDVCKLLVLLEDDKVIGRALVWKLASIKRMSKDVEEIEYFMDRQYTIKESDVQKFRNYAEKEGWAYKAYNNHHSYNTIKFNGEEFNVDMQVHVSVKEYRKYPYMDTFKRYNPDNGFLYNDDEDDSDKAGQYILDDTGGRYTEIESGVWSEWHDRTIDEDDAVWSDYADSYLMRNYAVEVTRGSRGNRGWYPEDHDDLCRAYDGNYYNINDTVYSDFYNDQIYEDDAIRVVTDIFSDGDVNSPDESWMQDDDRNIIPEREYNRLIWYDFLSDRFSDWNDFSGCHKDLLTKDSNENWIPKIFETKVYRVTDAKDDNPVDIMGTEYLLEIDANILGYNINKSDEKIIDMFQYSKDIDHLLSDIQEKVPVVIKKYEDILDDKGQKMLKFGTEEEQEYLRKIQNLKDRCAERLDEIESDKYYILN